MTLKEAKLMRRELQILLLDLSDNFAEEQTKTLTPTKAYKFSKKQLQSITAMSFRCGFKNGLSHEKAQKLFATLRFFVEEAKLKTIKKP